MIIPENMTVFILRGTRLRSVEGAGEIIKVDSSPESIADTSQKSILYLIEPLGLNHVEIKTHDKSQAKQDN